MYKLALLLALAPFAFAQTPPGRVIRATGTGSVTFRPDQAKLNISVVTQAPSALDAANDNATKSDAVIRAVSSVAGSATGVKTIGYSINPIYRTGAGQVQQITGYTATNTIEVTMNDTAIAGRVIDAASKAGANSFSSLRFQLANPEPARQQALSAASKVARGHAEAIASGLGLRAGAVLAAQEGSVYVPIVSQQRLGVADASATPIEAGTLEVTATVTIEVELL